MNVSSDPSQFEAKKKVFKISSDLVRKGSSSRARRYWLIGSLIAIAILLGGAIAWWTLGTTNGVQYTTAPVTTGPITRAVTATGTVNPELTVIVGTYVSGVIQSLSCDYNTEVKAGQICAKIDPRPYQATLDQYVGQLHRDEAILAKDRANLTRYQQLATENSIARQQAEDQAFIVKQDEATVELDRGLIEGATFNLGYTDIVSPVDGTVVSRNVTQGQTVAASFQTPTLFLIASDLKRMQVDTNVSESDIGGILEKNEASFTVDAFPKRVFRGFVSQVRQSPQTVQNVDNSDLALKPGMTTEARIVTDKRADVLRVPNQALRFVPRISATATGQAASQPAESSSPASNLGQVWILRDSFPAAVPVVVGLDDDSLTQIVSGDLKLGDEVITKEQNSAANAAVLPRLPY